MHSTKLQATSLKFDYFPYSSLKAIMQNSTHRRLSTKEAYKILDEILEEDRQEDKDEDSSDCRGPADCAEDVLPVVEKKFCECIRIAENSSRFSLRVMEAMRSLQNDEDDFLPTSSIDDIVDYIQKNYRDDGDLYAQVRTAVKQVCSQGFALELLENEYHLIGPDAASMNRITCSNSPKDCSLSYPKSKIPKSHKKDRSKNTCICETPHDEETGPTTSKHRRVSKSAAARDLERTNTKRERNNREEDKLTEESAECTCSSTLTDEDNVSKIQENMQHALDKKDKRRRKSVHESLIGTPSMRRINNQTMETGDTKKDRAAEIVKEMDEEDFEINDADESQNEIRSKKAIETEKELERWIERCRRECERRKDRRPQNN